MSALYRFAGWVAAILGLAVIFGAAPDGSHAKSTNSTLKIDATAVASLKYQIQSNPRTIKITPAHLKKGYVEVNNVTIISVSTNNPDGYVISLQAAAVNYFSSVKVTTKEGRTVSIAPGEGADIRIPGPINGTDIQKLSYKFTLTPSAIRGIYPWPITISIHM